jgi:molecular chaperone GrpE
MTKDRKREAPATDDPEEAAAHADGQSDAAAAADAPGEDGAGEPTSSEPEKTSEDEIAALRDRLLRALAENENLIRRARREREDTARYAAANFARDVLKVSDNLRRAMAAVPRELREGDEATRAFIEGVELTERELLSTLERHGITRISPLGEKFNHDRHEALFEVPTDEVEPGTVVQVMEDGYIIHDRLLRAARVGVARALPAAGDGHQVDTTA